MNLILDTSQPDHIKRFSSHTPPNPDNHYLLTSKNSKDLLGSSTDSDTGKINRSCLHSGGSKITALSDVLRTHLCRLKPERVILLVDNPARQGRVAAALYFWRWLYRMQFEIYLSWSGKLPVPLDSYHRYLLFRHHPSSFFKELAIFGALCLVTLTLLTVLFGNSLLPPMLLLVVLAEIVLRGRENKWRQRLAASPLGQRGTHDRGDRSYLFDEYLGRVEVPNLDTIGRISAPSEATEYKYRTRTNSQGWRITSLQDQKQSDPMISMFGCSFTFGSSLNDEETFPWLLQERLTDYYIRNYGIGSSSAYQALLLMEKTVPVEKPAVVVFCYQPTLDKRNIGRLDLLPWLVGPSCASLQSHTGKRILHRFPPRRYKKLPGARLSALVKATEKKLNWARSIGHNSDAIAVATMEHLLAQMRSTCEKHGASFIVASLTAYNPHQIYLQSHGFSWCSVDFDEKETDCDGKFKWSLLPYDKHPNAAANREFSHMIGDAIDKALKNERAMPAAAVLNRLAQLNKAPRKLEDFIYPHW